MATNPAGLEYTYVGIRCTGIKVAVTLHNIDLREVGHHARLDSLLANYSIMRSMEPDHVNLIKARIESGEATVLYTHNGAQWWAEEDLPLHFHWWKRIHPFHAGDDWAAAHILEDAMTMSYDEDGVPHITIDADVKFIHSGRVTRRTPRAVTPGVEPHWGERRVMVHDITGRLEQIASQFASEMQFYWSNQDAARFWATDKQLISWIALIREHLFILASGNTAHLFRVEVGGPGELGRPVHQWPIHEALPWMMDQLETMMAKGTLHFFDFHPAVFHSELGISPSSPTLNLWGVLDGDLTPWWMVGEKITESNWAVSRAAEYAASRRGDPVPYVPTFAERLYELTYAHTSAFRGAANFDTMTEWHQAWTGYASSLDAAGNAASAEVSVVPVVGSKSSVVAGDHALEVLGRHLDSDATYGILHDTTATAIALKAKLVARELWSLTAEGALDARLDIVHDQAAWDALLGSHYDRATTTKE